MTADEGAAPTPDSVPRYPWAYMLSVGLGVIGLTTLIAHLLGRSSPHSLAVSAGVIVGMVISWHQHRRRPRQ